MISVIYRLTEQEATSIRPGRPHWYNKSKCLKSFLNAVEFSKDVIDQVFFVHDGPGDFLLNQIPKKYNIVKINVQDNLKSFHTVLDIADNLNSNLYFIEDDYLHMPDSISATESMLPELKFITNYDQPISFEWWHLCIFPPVENKVAFDAKFNKLWRTTRLCCYTYAIERNIYNQQAEMLRSMGIEDTKMCIEMHKRGYPLWVSTPGLSTHVDIGHFGLGSPAVSWESFNNSIFLEK
jgi:hypothetical protein